MKGSREGIIRRVSREEAATWGPARENGKRKKKLTFLLGNVDTREAVDVST